MGIGCYLYKLYNYHDSRTSSYKWSETLFRLDVFGWDGYGLVLVEAL
jgi:hypothetical protein